MFQKETIPISFKEEYKEIGIVFKALKDTLVFMVEKWTEKGDSDNYQVEFELIFLHTDNHGKTLFKKKMRGKYWWGISVEMISQK